MDSLRIILILIGLVVIAGIFVWEMRRRARDRMDEHLADDGDIPDVLMDGGELPPLRDHWGDEASMEDEDLDHLRGLRGRSEPVPVEAAADVAVDAGAAPADDMPPPPRREAAAVREAPAAYAQEEHEPDEVLVEEAPASAAASRQEAAPKEAASVEPVVLALTVLAAEGETFAGRAILEAMQANGLVHGRMDIFHYYPDPEGAGDEPWFSIASAVEPGTFQLDGIDELYTPGLALFTQLPGPAAGNETFERMLEVARALARALDGELCDGRRQPLTPERLEDMWGKAGQF